MGSGCGSVGRAVASDTRGPWLESSHWQKFIYILNICLLSTVYWKDEHKEKEAGNGPFFKKKTNLSTFPFIPRQQPLNFVKGSWETFLPT